MLPQYIQLVSSDGFKFIVTREAALVSKTLRAMLTGEQFAESETGKLTLDSIDGAVLSKVVDYFYYNLKYKEHGEGSFEISPQMALELLVAADFLDT